MRKASLFKNGDGPLGYLHAKKKKKVSINPYIIPYIKMNSNWIIDLNVKLTNIMLLEENVGENFCDLG